MKIEEQTYIKIKIAISLNKLLSCSKDSIETKEVSNYTKSYNKIALSADLRKATVSDIFNAKSNCQIASLFPIIQAMGYSITDFAKVYDDISDSNIKKFLSQQKK
ncbi:hypothetical protein IV494_08575 [Kaistella sp. G5-32]|uniref:HTH cro/C1-type domain-containing protein n=1 Tax=Kaistella gelatinilytica TaxID=2787636 RepID=A0ABS0FC02_9FLAO|nr:hypothetical protein [Kaistella gelatinilytica]MBF8457236.1 hypothetical protein [Kaistella gelatinilytica]